MLYYRAAMPFGNSQRHKQFLMQQHEKKSSLSNAVDLMFGHFLNVGFTHFSAGNP